MNKDELENNLGLREKHFGSKVSIYFQMFFWRIIYTITGHFGLKHYTSTLRFGKTLFSLFSVTWDTDDLWKTILISHYFDCFLANCLICSFVKKTILFENITL